MIVDQENKLLVTMTRSEIDSNRLNGRIQLKRTKEQVLLWRL